VNDSGTNSNSATTLGLSLNLDTLLKITNQAATSGPGAAGARETE
jgi:hypothetical protein